MEFNISNRTISVAGKENTLSYNSDYTAHFTFDDEWENAIKTARFIQFGKHADMVLDKNNSCNIPIFKNGWVIVGIFNDVMTTTYTKFYFNRTVKDENSDPVEDPSPDVYSQLLEMIESGMVGGKDGKDGKTPVKGVDYFTDAEISQLITQPINEVKGDLSKLGLSVVDGLLCVETGEE